MVCRKSPAEGLSSAVAVSQSQEEELAEVEVAEAAVVPPDLQAGTRSRLDPRSDPGSVSAEEQALAA